MWRMADGKTESHEDHRAQVGGSDGSILSRATQSDLHAGKTALSNFPYMRKRNKPSYAIETALAGTPFCKGGMS